MTTTANSSSVDIQTTIYQPPTLPPKSDFAATREALTGKWISIKKNTPGTSGDVSFGSSSPWQVEFVGTGNVNFDSPADKLFCHTAYTLTNSDLGPMISFQQPAEQSTSGYYGCKRIGGERVEDGHLLVTVNGDSMSLTQVSKSQSGSLDVVGNTMNLQRQQN